jgi:hypothetical protein
MPKCSENQLIRGANIRGKYVIPLNSERIHIHFVDRQDINVSPIVFGLTVGAESWVSSACNLYPYLAF